MEQLAEKIQSFLLQLNILQRFGIKDIAEIIILAFIIYRILVWIMQTRAWNLLKGVLFFLVFLAVSKAFNMIELVYIMDKAIGVGIIAVIIIFQPELRKGLEHLGRSSSLLNLDNLKGRHDEDNITDNEINELVRACFAMGRVRTGALITIEQRVLLNDYARTGIELDSLISSQLIINIFEKNTPLHDGAVIVRGNRVIAATCYLPLSDNNELSKELGTRHRAALGISEVSDSFTIVVSEETGRVSVAYQGNLYRNLTEETLKGKLKALQEKNEHHKKMKKKKEEGKV